MVGGNELAETISKVVYRDYQSNFTGTTNLTPRHPAGGAGRPVPQTWFA